jgi:2-methylcitrate dehydratase PrpD
MAESKDSPLPGNVVEKAKHHILDTLGAMISGSELPPGRAAIRFATSYGGEKIATVAASKVLCGPIEAALANGVLAHSDGKCCGCGSGTVNHEIVPAAFVLETEV